MREIDPIDGLPVLYEHELVPECVMRPYTAHEWLREFLWFPSIQPDRCVASMSERRRLIEQKAVTVNGKKIGLNDPWPDEVTELVFFKGAKRQTTIR